MITSKRCANRRQAKWNEREKYNRRNFNSNSFFCSPFMHVCIYVHVSGFLHTFNDVWIFGFIVTFDERILLGGRRFFFFFFNTQRSLIFDLNFGLFFTAHGERLDFKWMMKTNERKRNINWSDHYYRKVILFFDVCWVQTDTQEETETKRMWKSATCSEIRQNTRFVFHQTVDFAFLAVECCAWVVRPLIRRMINSYWFLSDFHRFFIFFFDRFNFADIERPEISFYLVNYLLHRHDNINFWFRKHSNDRLSFLKRESDAKIIGFCQ